MRVFIAVFPSQETVDRVADCIDRCRKKDDGISWVRPGNLHYTLRFLGELEDRRVAAVSRAVETSVLGGKPFSLTLGKTGAFPNFRRPRVLWIGTEEGGSQLETLARAMNEALGQGGFNRPDKPFRAHLTVGRVRDAARAQDSFQRFAEQKVSGTFEVSRVVVVHSTLDPRGSVYRPLKEVSLGAPGA